MSRKKPRHRFIVFEVVPRPHPTTGVMCGWEVWDRDRRQSVSVHTSRADALPVARRMCADDTSSHRTVPPTRLTMSLDRLKSLVTGGC